MKSKPMHTYISPCIDYLKIINNLFKTLCYDTHRQTCQNKTERKSTHLRLACRTNGMQSYKSLQNLQQALCWFKRFGKAVKDFGLQLL